MAEQVYMALTLHLQKKYNKVNELQDLTKQMAECLQRDDMVSFHLFMRMREKTMLEIDSLEYAQEDILKGMPTAKETFAREALTVEAHEKGQETAELCRIHEIYNSIKRSLQSTIQYDKAISLKVGGENSFYKK